MKLKDMPSVRRDSDETANRNAAYERIYEHYGTDLAAFFRDVYKEAALRREKIKRSNAEKSEVVPAS